MRRVINGGARRILVNGLAIASRLESIVHGGWRSEPVLIYISYLRAYGYCTSVRIRIQ